MMTSSKPVNPYNSMQICLIVVKYFFQFGFFYFKDIFDKVTAYDEVTCMMTARAC